MNIFTLNCGSSSIKYQLFQMPDVQPICSGLIEKIGHADAKIKHKVFIAGKEDTIEETVDLPNHEMGVRKLIALLTNPDHGVIKNADEVEVVGHRVVHGGEKYTAAVLVTEEVKSDIQQYFSLAPLHNPANFTGIEVATKCFAKAKQVAVFDTAFHHTIPERAFRFAIPNELYTESGIRVYGFHGTSHQYVSNKAMDYLQNPTAKLISIHLGNGCSMAAIVGGKSIDTSMGFGPLNGLVMGTRSGAIDPTVIFHLIEQKGYTPKEVDKLLNSKSGMLGLTGFNDMRDVNKAIANNDAAAALACEIYAYRIQKYIGEYVAAMNGLDAIIFTAGVGENDASMRARVCKNMDFFGIVLNEEKNNTNNSDLREISDKEAKVKILVVPTNEELEMAQQAFALLGN